MVKGVGDDFFVYKKEDYKKLPKYILDAIDKRNNIYHCTFFDDGLGYNTFTKIKSYNACCNYIIKYISKDPVRNENDQIYFCSRGLIKCICEEYRSYIPERYFDGSYTHTYTIINSDTLQPEEHILCRVKDIYSDNFNKDTKMQYYLDTASTDYAIL